MLSATVPASMIGSCGSQANWSSHARWGRAAWSNDPSRMSRAPPRSVVTNPRATRNAVDLPAPDSPPAR